MPYMKIGLSAAIQDGWRIEGGGGKEVAHVATEKMADVLLDHLLGYADVDGLGGVEYPQGVLLGEYHCKDCEAIWNWLRGVEKCPSCGGRRVGPVFGVE